MNNILDYSHLIKTYVMMTSFDNNYNLKCTCDKSIECFQINELIYCKNYKLILDNLPLFNILINPNFKKTYSLPKTSKNSDMDVVDFIKVLLYVIKFKDESIDYLLNKKYIKCVILLSIYILIINNYNIIKNIMYIFESFIVKIRHDLNNNYLNNQDNINKLHIVFKKYFKESPDECINIMKNWEDILIDLIYDEI